PSAQREQRQRALVAPPRASKAATPRRAQENADSTKAEELFRDGKYETALTTYEALRSRVPEAERDVLEYRIGLCQELLGRRDDALATYKKISGDNARPIVAALAELSQARIYGQSNRP